MLKQLTITFKNKDSVIIPAKAIHYLNIEDITQNITFVGRNATPYQKAKFIEFSLYEDAIAPLKTTHMQNQSTKTTINESLTYPDIESIRLDNNEPIYVQWAPVKTHNDRLENLYQISEENKDINDKPLLTIEIGKPNPERNVF